MNAARLLVDKLEKLGTKNHIDLTGGQIDKLLRMDEWVVKWNRSISLIGFANDAERIDRFFIEAVHAATWLPKNGNAIDIGSGGGSPALPMAVCRPDICWTLLEPNQRKKVFLEEISTELSLKQIHVVRQRYEHYQPKTKVRVVTTRGVLMNMGSIKKMHTWLEAGGQIMLLTGDEARDRIARDIDPPWSIAKEVFLSPRQESRLVVLELT